MGTHTTAHDKSLPERRFADRPDRPGEGTADTALHKQVRRSHHSHSPPRKLAHNRRCCVCAAQDCAVVSSQKSEWAALEEERWRTNSRVAAAAARERSRWVPERAGAVRRRACGSEGTEAEAELESSGVGTMAAVRRDRPLEGGAGVLRDNRTAGPRRCDRPTSAWGFVRTPGAPLVACVCATHNDRNRETRQATCKQRVGGLFLAPCPSSATSRTASPAPRSSVVGNLKKKKFNK